MMATFNSIPTLSSNGPDALGLTHGGQVLGMDPFDTTDLGFDESLLDSVHGLPQIPFTPSYDFETFSTTFEDPFASYQTRPYDAVAPDGLETYNGEEEASPQELDNKLLGFGAPIPKASIVTDDGNIKGQPGDAFSEPPSVGMSAELLGMFFVAEDVFGGDTNPSRPMELTCYRRNLWNCSGTITLPRSGVSGIITENGQHIPVVDLVASITAVESIESKAAEIISIPWKGTTGGGSDEVKVGAGAPPQVPLDLAGGQEVDGNKVSVPVSWKRLQFKHATANNGRRKGLQQHYVVQINLLGKTKAGEFVKISEIQSGPVIVRGRSPRNFDSKRDVPVSTEKKPERRLTGDVSTPAPLMTAMASGNGRPNAGDMTQSIHRYQTLSNVQSNDWMSAQVNFAQLGTPGLHTQQHLQPHQQQQQQQQHQQQQQLHPSKKLALSPNLPRPPVPAWSSDTSFNTNQQQHRMQPVTPSQHNIQHRPSLPINLSLSEDERSPNNRSSSTSEALQSPSLERKLTGGALEPNPGSSPVETAEMLYEYFPLSLDDWMPPVDAIYRPHVVHHTIVPPEVKAQQTKSKTKRYFAAE